MLFAIFSVKKKKINRKFSLTSSIYFIMSRQNRKRLKTMKICLHLNKTFSFLWQHYCRAECAIVEVQLDQMTRNNNTTQFLEFSLKNERGKINMNAGKVLRFHERER